jgi:hypothetical protein
VAVDRVAQLGDTEATAEALSLYHHTLMLLPDRVKARLQVADELLDVATRPRQPSTRCSASAGGRSISTTSATAKRDEPSSTCGNGRPRWGASLSATPSLSSTSCARSGAGSGAGQGLAEEALTLGLAVRDADALAYRGGHLLAIRWAQGRVDEMVETIASVLEPSTLHRRDQIYPGPPGLRPRATRRSDHRPVGA